MKVACIEGQAEVFGPTIQGEGPSTGRNAVFIRLSGCNLTCTWCDTKYTWDWANYNRDEEQTQRTAYELVKLADRLAHPGSILVITGGEPLIQRNDVYQIALDWAGGHVEIETNGTRHPKALGDMPSVYFNVSPKLANSGVDADRRIVPDVLTYFARHPHASFKFVVETDDDLAEVQWFQAEFGIPPWAMWIMPQGVDRVVLTERGRSLVDRVTALGYNLTMRQHVTLWPNERAR